MNRQDFTDNFLQHYESPRNYGPLPDADVISVGANPGCGDVITIYLRVSNGHVAQRIQFEAEGCAISRGATSILLDRVQKKSLAEIQAIDYNDLVDQLGRDIVLGRVKCATLGLSTLKQAIQQYNDRHSGDRIISSPRE